MPALPPDLTINTLPRNGRHEAISSPPAKNSDALNMISHVIHNSPAPEKQSETASAQLSP